MTIATTSSATRQSVLKHVPEPATSGYILLWGLPWERGRE